MCEGDTRVRIIRLSFQPHFELYHLYSVGVDRMLPNRGRWPERTTFIAVTKQKRPLTLKQLGHSKNIYTFLCHYQDNVFV